MKLLLPLSVFLLSLNSFSSETSYQVYGKAVDKRRSWYIENSTLYNTDQPTILKWRDVDYLTIKDPYSFMENVFTTGFNALRTEVDLDIFKDDGLYRSNALADFMDYCAEEYSLNVILKIRQKDSVDKRLLENLAKFTIHYPNLVGVEVNGSLEIGKAILLINPEIMIIASSKTNYQTDIPQTKFLAY